MQADIHTLGISSMSVEERLALVHAIWDSIAESTSGVPLSDAQLELVKQRAEKHRGGREPTLSWDEVKRRSVERLEQ